MSFWQRIWDLRWNRLDIRPGRVLVASGVVALIIYLIFSSYCYPQGAKTALDVLAPIATSLGPPIAIVAVFLAYKKDLEKDRRARLYEKRADALAEMWGLLGQMIVACERVDGMKEPYNRFKAVYSARRLFIDKALCHQIDQLLTEVETETEARRHVTAYGTLPNHDFKGAKQRLEALHGRLEELFRSCIEP